ncbi:MAG: leucyl aminopeptidase [Streptosporangiales bacterium]|nr:leucyl aminopeptidase [Streptosporangiales bacterium]
MTTLSLSTTPVGSLAVDALVIGIVAAPTGPRAAPGAEGIDDALGNRLTPMLQTMRAEAKAEEVTKIPTLDAVGAPLIVAVGLGPEPSPEPPAGSGYDLELLRRAAGAATRALAGAKSVALALPARTAAETAAVAEGALLGNYAFLRYRTGGEQKAPVEDVTVVTQTAGNETAGETGETATAGAEDVSAALQRAEVISSAVGLARDLVNTPPCDLYPQGFAEIAQTTAAEAGLQVEVLDEHALADGGYGGILGVGQGSSRPPRLVRLAYAHPEATRMLVLVGKGITFDSGGLSLKPSSSMDWMKSDMGGAATVLGAVSAAARLRLRVNVVGYLPLAENMPSGTAQRPSDVLRTYGGTTVEVLNTDAEGRLVLADTLARAAQDRPDLIVDAATLTGAQMVALGTRTAAVMANDDDVRERVVQAAERAGESMWPMPLPEELRKSLDSSVADIANVANDRWAGMLVAGVFLREFVPADVRWAHLDIAGPSFNQGEPYGYTPKGGTGAGTRTLIQIADDLAAGRL